MVDLEVADLGMAGDAGVHPAGVVVGTTGYITTGAGFTPEDDPGSATPGIRPMTGGEREVWEGKVAGEPAREEANAAGARQCRQVRENGYRCTATPSAGKTFCHHATLESARLQLYRGAGAGISMGMRNDRAPTRIELRRCAQKWLCGSRVDWL